MLEHLDRHQRDEYLWFGTVHVVGSRGGLYRVSDPYVYRNGLRYCLQPTILAPVEDAILTRVLMIRADEGYFLSKAFIA